MAVARKLHNGNKFGVGFTNDWRLPSTCTGRRISEAGPHCLHKWSAEISTEIAEPIASVGFDVACTMKLGRGQHEVQSVPADDRPRGTPEWISSDLIADTIATWQPYYAEPLTIDEAIAIIEGVGRLMESLSPESVP